MYISCAIYKIKTFCQFYYKRNLKIIKLIYKSCSKLRKLTYQTLKKELFKFLDTVLKINVLENLKFAHFVECFIKWPKFIKFTLF